MKKNWSILSNYINIHTQEKFVARVGMAFLKRIQLTKTTSCENHWWFSLSLTSYNCLNEDGCHVTEKN
jgi:hypothetical protein